MKKRIALLLCLMLVFTMTSSMAFAADGGAVAEQLEIETLPTGKIGLEYKGSEQKLLETLGTVKDGKGTMQYYVSEVDSTLPEGAAFTADEPKGTNAGTYYVWYKAVPKDTINYADSDVCTEPIKVEIAKATYTGDKTASASLVYGREGEVDLTDLIVDGGTASYTEPDDVVNSDGILGSNNLNDEKNKLKFKVKDYCDNEGATNTATCTIHVTSRNYQNYDIVVTITALDKAPQSITVTDKYNNGTVTLDSEGGKYKAKYEYIDLYSSDSNDIKYGITAAAEADKTGVAAGTAGDISYEVTSGKNVLSINEATGEIMGILEIGTATVTVTAAESDDCKRATTTVEITITKKSQLLNDAFSKPIGATTLIYTGEEQTLISDTNAGVLTSTGKLLFTLGTADAPYDAENNPAPDETFDYGFKETAPKGINAGTYYVWYKAAGDDYTEESKPCTKPIAVTIAKCMPTEAVSETVGKHEYMKPAGLTTFSGDKLSNIALTNPASGLAGTWEWMTADSSVGEVSETPKIFKAKFIPQDTMNYETVENIDLSVTVTAKPSSSSASSTSYAQKPTISFDTADVTATTQSDGSTVYVTSEGRLVLSKDGKTASIEASEGYEVASVSVNGTEKGAVTTLTALRTGDKVEVIFKPDAQKKAEIAKLNALLEKPSLTARSSKTGKGNIKVVFRPDDETESFISEMKALGYTVKYRFYRSTKKSSGYKSMLTKSGKTYINTSGKAGTRYYYKVQVRVYDENGKLVAKTALKQCKYATRIFG